MNNNEIDSNNNEINRSSYMNNNEIDSNNEINRSNYMNNNDDNIDLYVCIYSDLEEDIKNNNDVCSICFEKNDCDDILTLTKCNHVYHYKCINEWIKIGKTCPLCRAVI